MAAAPRLVRKARVVRRLPFEARCGKCGHCLSRCEMPVIVTFRPHQLAQEIKCVACGEVNYARVKA
jgi:MinD superfamily P-loop ATPase